MEAHSQNFLLELDASDKPTGRFIHRDLAGFTIDSRSTLYQAPVQDLPVFDTFKKDYHQRSIAKAQRKSIDIYFKHGLLFNIDRLLKSTDSNYIPESIYQEAKEVQLKAIADFSGAPLEKLKQLRADDDVLAVAKKARPKKRGIPLPQWNDCFRRFWNQIL